MVSDIYGRPLGRVIGIDRNPFGELEGIQVEAVGGSILTVKTRQVSLTPSKVTLTPEWKLDVQNIALELNTLHKRIEALRSLKDTKEIDGEIYAELLEAQKAGYLDKVKSGEALAAVIEARFGELTLQISNLTKYLVHAKLGHKSGEVDDASLKLAQDSIEPSLRPLMAERNDLAVEMKNLQRILPTRVELSARDP